MNQLFEMDDAASEVFEGVFNVEIGIPPFNPADSNLELLETEEFKAEIEEKLQNNEITGF